VADQFADGPDAAGRARILEDEAKLRRGWIGPNHLS
jgi:hypothetical protein